MRTMALTLIGTTEGINLPLSTVTKNRSALTGMAWVRARTWNSGAANNKVFGYSIGTNATNSRFTLIALGASPGQLQVGGRALDADSQRTLNSPTVLSTNVWHHVVGIIDYATNFGYIYIDGVLDTAGAVSGAFGATSTENTNSLSTGIGVREGGAGQQGIDGLIDDFRLYSGILGPAVIQTIYTGRGADGINTNLLHRYPLNDLVPGTTVASVACIAAAELLVGTPLGTPSFAAGITVNRHRRRSTSHL